ncbi:MAG: Smr/MutS family protein, partial [Spirochaetaceae bacterium]|nr:Smr/MutS family protein [Spirochaetaceae bacterium]
GGGAHAGASVLALDRGRGRAGGAAPGGGGRPRTPRRGPAARGGGGPRAGGGGGPPGGGRAPGGGVFGGGAGAGRRAPAPPRLDVEVNTSGTRPLAELNVRGLRLDEALAAVERQVDGALLAGLRQCAIVHGRGEGVLRHGIHQYLERRREVVEFEPAEHRAGGAGKTIVTLA